MTTEDDPFNDVEDLTSHPAEWDGPMSPKDFMRVIATGTKLQKLCAMRDRVAQMLAYADAGPDVSSLALRLNQLLDQIEATPDPDALPKHADGEAPVDFLEAMRSKRGTKEAPRRQNASGRRRRSNR
jgi:hypothetical protein